MGKGEQNGRQGERQRTSHLFLFISKKLRTFAQAKLREYRNFASKSMKYPFKKMSKKPKRNPQVE